MKKSLKIWLITAVVLVFCGTVLFVLSIALAGGELSRLGAVKYITNTYDADAAFNSISINTDTADVVFALSDDNKCTVECFEEETKPHRVSVQDGTLKIAVEDNSKWYQLFLFNPKKPKLTVSLPKIEYDSLIIKNDTGDVKIPSDFIIADVDISLSTGDVKIEAPKAENIKIKVSTGDINISGTNCSGNVSLTSSTGDMVLYGINAAGNITASVSTGIIKMTNVECTDLISTGSTGDIRLSSVIAGGSFDIERSTGDVTFNNCDAEQIRVKTSTGDVEGTLKTSKIFFTETSTGKVSVPKTTTGGICEIKTTSGDIIIEVIS
ncbi:MAG: DUF4097 family beta strand repeat protein [Clostridia bacterium]|nr:DUF4097 family beta strand repeat protein [Clostridia bacterium]